jgi:hypothetical protein
MQQQDAHKAVGPNSKPPQSNLAELMAKVINKYKSPDASAQAPTTNTTVKANP